MKRVISFIFAFVIILSSSIIPVYATSDAEEWPIDFTAGLNSDYADNYGKMSLIIPVLLDIYGVEVESSGVSDFKMSIYTLLNKLYAYDSSLYNEIYNNATVERSAGRYVVSFSEGFLNLTSPVNTGLRRFFSWLCGDAALSGDPFEETILNDQYVSINGVNVIAWKSNKELSRMYGSQDVNILPIRGSYIIPPYFSQWYDIYSSANHQKKLTFDVIDVNGDTITLSTAYNLVARSTESNTDGNVKDIRYTTGGSNFSLFYAAPTTNSYAAQAYLPVITQDGYLCICNYTYLYSGTITPGSWPKHTYLLLPLTNSQIIPQKFDAGSSTYKGELNTGEITNNVYNVYGDTYETVINNYYNGDPLTSPPYIDPFSWDTGGGGNITQDGDGWSFSLDGFHLPDLNIDWQIDGLKDKFPFSIPWDLIQFFTILNVDPQAPHIQGEIDLIITTWEIDFDFSQFDDIASLFRNLFYISFVVGLIFYTKDFLKR